MAGCLPAADLSSTQAGPAHVVSIPDHGEWIAISEINESELNDPNRPHWGLVETADGMHNG